MIRLPKRKTNVPQGAFGKYFQVTPTRGVKVLRGSFRNLESAYNSHIFDMAREESEILKVAQNSGVVPKCYGVRIVRRGNRYYVGILMQHLGNKRLSDMKVSVDKESQIYDDLNDALEDAGIGHNDLHAGNIMYYKGKYYAIDFSPDLSNVNDSN